MVPASEISFDFSGLNAGMVEPDLAELADCDVAGRTATCPFFALGAGETWPTFVRLINHGGLGPAGTFTVTLAAGVPDPDPSNNQDTVAVEVVPSGGDLQAVAFDLVAGFDEADLPIPVTPGDSAEFVWAIFNEGDRWVAGLEFTLALPGFFHFIDEFDICEYDGGVATCSDPDAVIAPGEAYAPDEPTLVQLEVGAAGPAVLDGGHVSATPIDLVEEPPELASAPPAPGFQDDLDQGALQQLLAQNDIDPIEADPGDNTATFVAHIGGRLPNDLAATATPAEGEVGEVIEVEFAITNHGPGTSAPSFVIQAPSGTVILSQAGVFEYRGNFPGGDGTFPVACRDGDGRFEGTETAELTCDFEGEMPAGLMIELTMPFEIRSADVADGRITVRDLTDLDSNPDNDSAPIVISVPGGGQGGGLPVTGIPALLIGGTGAAVLAAGAGLFFVARRRRVVLATPDTDG